MISLLPRRRKADEAKKEKSAGAQLVELVVIIAVALGLALGIQAVLIKPYRIPSGSMLPTLKIGQRVLVDRIGTHFKDPHVGDIVVFHPPAPADAGTGGKGPNGMCGVDNADGEPCPRNDPRESKVNFIKRVVAGPGDRLSIVGGHVILNGRRLKEPYIAPCSSTEDCNYPKTITIPPDHWFMMGDNRGESEDSRYWGPVPKKWIIGGAFATYWPIDRIGFL
ncbi:MAG TPA: signal peptidase I [Solirubrobacteraceae bacterium]|nr:signal peptidase I [Solirubrobacteraceae bacterium]